MKTKILIEALLLGLLIIVTTLGRTYMPEWVLALSVLSIFVCVIYYTLILYSEGKSFFEEKFKTLNSNIEESKKELFKLQNDQILELTNLIVDKHNSLQVLVSNSTASINNESAKRAASVMEQLVAQSAVIEKKFKNEAEIINTLSETTKSHSSLILSKIASNSDKIEKLFNILTDMQQASKKLRQIIENNQEIVTERFQQNSKVLAESIEKGVLETSNIITDSLEKTQLAVKESNNSLLHTAKAHYDVLNNLIGTVSDKNDTLNQTLETSVLMLSDKLDRTKEQVGGVIKTMEVINQQNVSLQEAVVSCNELVENATNSIKSSIDQHKADMIEHMQQNADSVSENVDGYVANAVTLLTMSIIEVKEAYNNTEWALQNSLEKQTVALSSDLKKMNELNPKIKDSLKSIQEQCFSMQRGLAGVQIQSNNVEKNLNSFVSKNTNDKIIESIKTLIDNLHKELKSNVSDIKEELLETQIKQESTNDQLNRLQTLLRNLSKDLSNPLPLEKPIPKQPEEKKKLTPVLPTPSSQEPNPNRTETIVDSQTNNIVLNQFVSGKLAKSTMKDVKGHLLYELEYKNGQIARSRNYDIKGNMNIEQTFYDNGQVHFRNEITENGKITTEFDRNGNKK